MKHSDCQHCLGISAQNGNQAAIPTSWCIIKLCLLQQHLIAFHNFSSGRSSLMAQDFDKGAAFTRCSGTHHQKVEIAPTLNKRGSLVSTQKFSWISSTRASPRPRSSLGNIREVVPLRVYPREHRPPPHCPNQNRKLLRQSRDWVSSPQELGPSFTNKAAPLCRGGSNSYGRLEAWEIFCKVNCTKHKVDRSQNGRK